MALALSGEMIRVAHASGLRVRGFDLVVCRLLSAERIERDDEIQTPTRKPDAWGTLAP
jgi:hypothetical protein